MIVRFASVHQSLSEASLMTEGRFVSQASDLLSLFFDGRLIDLCQHGTRFFGVAIATSMIDKMHQAVDLLRNRRRMNMKSAISLAAIVMASILSGSADAHSIRVECKKLNADNVVCRSLFSDGEVARNMLVQLIDENDRVVASGRTDTEGKYAFKAPTAEYNVVVEANKGHVASMSSEDIW
jgi:hypothetical protein